MQETVERSADVNDEKPVFSCHIENGRGCDHGGLSDRTSGHIGNLVVCGNCMIDTAHPPQMSRLTNTFYHLLILYHQESILSSVGKKENKENSVAYWSNIMAQIDALGWDRASHLSPDLRRAEIEIRYQPHYLNLDLI